MDCVHVSDSNIFLLPHYVFREPSLRICSLAPHTLEYFVFLDIADGIQGKFTAEMSERKGYYENEPKGDW